jgi:hypothetical protein
MAAPSLIPGPDHSSPLFINATDLRQSYGIAAQMMSHPHQARRISLDRIAMLADERAPELIALDEACQVRLDNCKKLRRVSSVGSQIPFGFTIVQPSRAKSLPEREDLGSTHS